MMARKTYICWMVATLPGIRSAEAAFLEGVSQGGAGFLPTSTMGVIVILTVLTISGLLIQVARLRSSHERMVELSEHQFAAEEALKAAQSIAHLGSWEQDLKTDNLKWSDEAFRILGLAPGSVEPTGRTFALSVHPEDRKKVLTVWSNAIQAVESYTVDHRVVRPDGSVRHVRERADVLSDSTGKAFRVIGTAQDITEQVEAEKALAESEAYFRSITENALDLITILDAEGTIIYGSPSINPLFGYDAEDLIGRSIYDIVHRDDLDEMRGRMALLMDPEQAQGDQDIPTYRFRHKDGGWRVLESSARLLPDVGDGTSRRTMVINRDVTARLRAEQELRESQSRLEGLLEIAPEAIIVIDDKSKVQIFNKGAEDVFGYQAEEIVGRDLAMLIPEEFRAGHQDKVDGFGRSDDVTRTMKERLGLRALCKDGTEILAEASISKLQTPDGMMFTVLLRDITERTRIEAVVEEQRRVLEAIVTNMPTVFAIKDTECRYVMVNHEFERLFRLDKEDVIGKTAFDLFPREFAAHHNAFDLKVLNSGQPVTSNATLDDEGGGHRTLITKRFPITSDDGAMLGTALIATDVTDLKNTEESLRQARREADLANSAKSEFLANMSHELRTPLNAILGFSEMLQQAPFGRLGDDRYSEYSDHIHDSGSHLLEIINDILDLSRIEAGQLELHEEEVDIEEAADWVSMMLRVRAANGQITLRNDIPRDLPLLRADNRIIRQILLNLLSNAVKFTQTGGEVAITAYVSEEAGLTIEVSDQGIGISAADANRVLKPFGQVDGSLTRDFEGVGLGLPLTKSFVELHGGELWLESELGVGTTVSLTFPPSRIIPRAEQETNCLPV